MPKITHLSIEHYNQMRLKNVSVPNHGTMHQL